MALAIGGVLVVLCVAVAALPFVRKLSTSPPQADPILELQEQRQAIYLEVRTLHGDHNLGQVAPAEYERRLQSYRIMAAALLQQQEQLQELDQRLEEEVLHRRDNLNVSSHEAACHECGQKVDPAAKQCATCGTALFDMASE